METHRPAPGDRFELDFLAEGIGLTRHFQLSSLICPDAESAAEALAVIESRVVRLRPGFRFETIVLHGPQSAVDLTRRLLEPLLAEARPETLRVVDAMGAGTADRGAWHYAFARFNEQRNDVIHRENPVLLVLPPWLQFLLAEAAPDVWSIVNVAARYQRQMPERERGEVLASAVRPGLETASEDGGLERAQAAADAVRADLAQHPTDLAMRATLAMMLRRVAWEARRCGRLIDAKHAAQEAVEHWEQLLVARPGRGDWRRGFGRALVVLGECWRQLRETREALAALDRAADQVAGEDAEGQWTRVLLELSRSDANRSDPDQEGVASDALSVALAALEDAEPADTQWSVMGDGWWPVSVDRALSLGEWLRSRAHEKDLFGSEERSAFADRSDRCFARASEWANRYDRRVKMRQAADDRGEVLVALGNAQRSNAAVAAARGDHKAADGYLALAFDSFLESVAAGHRLEGLRAAWNIVHIYRFKARAFSEIHSVATMLAWNAHEVEVRLARQERLRACLDQCLATCIDAREELGLLDLLAHIGSEEERRQARGAQRAWALAHPEGPEAAEIAYQTLFQTDHEPRPDLPQLYRVVLDFCLGHLQHPLTQEALAVLLNKEHDCGDRQREDLLQLAIDWAEHHHLLWSVVEVLKALLARRELTIELYWRARRLAVSVLERETWPWEQEPLWLAASSLANLYEALWWPRQEHPFVDQRQANWPPVDELRTLLRQTEVWLRQRPPEMFDAVARRLLTWPTLDGRELAVLDHLVAGSPFATAYDGHLAEERTIELLNRPELPPDRRAYHITRLAEAFLARSAEKVNAHWWTTRLAAIAQHAAFLPRELRTRLVDHAQIAQPGHEVEDRSRLHAALERLRM